jgi:hypothetical protein
MSNSAETWQDNFMEERNYRSFLLRCWQEEEEAGPSGEPDWRFVLVHFDHEQKKKGFSCLKALMAYLQAELGCVD